MYVRYVGPATVRWVARRLLGTGAYVDYVINQDKVTDLAAQATVEELQRGEVRQV